MKTVDFGKWGLEDFAVVSNSNKCFGKKNVSQGLFTFRNNVKEIMITVGIKDG